MTKSTGKARKLWIWSHLSKKSVMENSVSCAHHFHGLALPGFFTRNCRTASLKKLSHCVTKTSELMNLKQLTNNSCFIEAKGGEA